MVSKTQLALILTLLLVPGLRAQTGSVSLDPSSLQIIPNITAVSASPTHLFVLSSTEGLVVYRTRPDTLQWLFTAEGMASRGSRLTSDSRFSYLTGADNRLSILEPTALQGVWSSVFLPARPRLSVRSGTYLFTVTDNNGLYAVPLTRPADVERFDTISVDGLRPDAITDLIVFNRQILALSGRILTFLDPVGNQLRNATTQRLSQDALRLFDLNGVLHASNARGELFEVRGGGSLRKVLDIPEPIRTVVLSGRHYHIRSETGRLWILNQDGRVTLRKPNPESGNHIVLVNDRVWMSDFSRFGRAIVSETGGLSASAPALRLKPVPNQTVLLPRPLLLALELEAGSGSVVFTASSPTATPVIRGKGLYWQPGNNQVGLHHITVRVLSESGLRDSIRFTVDVRNFNQPPRFTPLRPVTIVANEPYSTTLRAVDPDSPSPDLIRYTGTDLPAGSTLSERTGQFNWTPDLRQIGVHTFTIRATDSHGVSAETTVTITVRGPTPTARE